MNIKIEIFLSAFVFLLYMVHQIFDYPSRQEFEKTRLNTTIGEPRLSSIHVQKKNARNGVFHWSVNG